MVALICLLKILLLLQNTEKAKPSLLIKSQIRQLVQQETAPNTITSNKLWIWSSSATIRRGSMNVSFYAFYSVKTLQLWTISNPAECRALTVKVLCQVTSIAVLYRQDRWALIEVLRFALLTKPDITILNNAYLHDKIHTSPDFLLIKWDIMQIINGNMQELQW